MQNGGKPVRNFNFCENYNRARVRGHYVFVYNMADAYGVRQLMNVAYKLMFEYVDKAVKMFIYISAVVNVDNVSFS